MRTVNPAFLGSNVSYFNDLGRFGITKHYILWAVWVILCSSDFSKSPYQPLLYRTHFLHLPALPAVRARSPRRGAVDLGPPGTDRAVHLGRVSPAIVAAVQVGLVATATCGPAMQQLRIRIALAEASAQALALSGTAAPPERGAPSRASRAAGPREAGGRYIPGGRGEVYPGRLGGGISREAGGRYIPGGRGGALWCGQDGTSDLSCGPHGAQLSLASPL